MVAIGDGNAAMHAQLDELRKQISRGFKRRDENYLKTIFDQYKDNTCNAILKPNLVNALSAVDIIVKDEEIDHLFFLLDRNDDHRIDFEEFKRAVHKPTALEQWAQTVPLTQLLADSIPEKAGCDPLKTVSDMSNDDIEVLSIAYMEGFKKMLAESIQRLRKAFEAQEMLSKQAQTRMSTKFEICCLSCGRITDFHKGVSGRVGAPHMDFLRAMEAEHCARAGCNEAFTSGNYQISFTPKQEWEIIVCGKAHLADMRHDRTLPVLADLLKSDEAVAAQLTDYEIIALVLYTGPMYMIYNGILRQFPKEHFQCFHDGGNLFSSTIHALVSAVQKIARVTRLPSGLLLYRGLGGTVELPDFFFKGDDQGCRGFADWGFMSTTSSKAVAMQYSGVKEGKPLATVLEVRVGAVDRGACVRFFSQYPGEVEYLWVPCSFLEPVGVQYLEVTAEGVVTVIPIRVNANLKALTTDELVKQKQQMHLAALRYMLDEMERDLWEEAHRCDAVGQSAKDPSVQRSMEAASATATEVAAAAFPREYIMYPISRKPACNGSSILQLTQLHLEVHGVPVSWEGFVQRIIAQCREIYTRHEAVPATDYLNDERYRSLVSDMLDCKDMALSKLRWWFEDETQHLLPNWDEPLRSAHRGRLAFLQRTLPSLPGANDDGGGTDGNRSGGGVDVGGMSVVAAAEARREAAARLCKLKALMLADVEEMNETGETRILAAAAEGWSHGNVKLLIAAGADVGARDKNGETAVFKAARYGHADLITLLVAHRADARAVDTLQGSTAMHKAAMNDQAECILALIAAGADIEAQTKDLRTPLHVASWLGQLSAIRVLIEARANVNLVDDETAAGVARGTPLHKAALRGNLAVVRMLLAAKADVRCRTMALDTPLHAAAARHADGCVAAELLAAGADVNARNRAGETPMDVACDGMHDLLRRHGGLPCKDVPESERYLIIL